MSRIKKVAFLLLIILPFYSINAQETKTISTEIQGIVPPVFRLSTDMTAIETVDLVNSESAYLGKVIVYTNTTGLWTIVIKSSNGGKLTGKSAGNKDVYPYSLGFGTVDRIDLSTDFILTYNTLVPKTTIEYPVSINYEKLENLDEPVVSDTYSDIVVITVTVS